MGALNEGHFHVELENGTERDGLYEGFEHEPETSAIKDAVKVLLRGLGEDIDREGIRKTPFRVAKALREGTKGYKQNAKDIVQDALFPEAGLGNAVGSAGGVGGLVIVRDLDFYSYCECCLLPFQVKCHVGYIPSSQRVVGLSKLSRVAHVFAKRLQEPKRLADEICSALQHGIEPSGVAVVLQCLHIPSPSSESFSFEPNHQGWLKAQVHSGSGVFENEKASAWVDFLGLLKFRDIDADRTRRPLKDSMENCWCPSSVKVSAQSSPEMADAVASILKCLGEDPLRKELVETPRRYVKWLMNFQNTSFEMKFNGFANGKVGSSTSDSEITHNKERIHSELNLSFWSQCEHHLLPFYGVVHIGYFSDEEVDASKRSVLQSVVHFYGFKLQVQERMTRQIAETVSSLLGGDVIVVAEADHTCMISRGIEKFGCNTATIAVLGRFSTDTTVRATFLQSIPASQRPQF